MTDDRRTYIVMAEGEAQAAAGNITNTYVTVACTPCPHREQRLLAQSRTLCSACEGQQFIEFIASIFALAVVLWAVFLFPALQLLFDWCGFDGAEAHRIALQFAALFSALASIAVHQGYHIDALRAFTGLLKRIRSMT